MKDVSRDELVIDQKAIVLKNGNIQINDLQYSIEETKILKNINFNLSSGEKLGIVGSVGSGKSSILKNIIGYILPNPGTLFLSDYEGISANVHKVLKNRDKYKNRSTNARQTIIEKYDLKKVALPLHLDLINRALK